jgi:hypothetical protein
VKCLFSRERKEKKKKGTTRARLVCMCVYTHRSRAYIRQSSRGGGGGGGKAGYITNTRQRIRRDRTDTFAPESRKVDCRNPIGFCNGHPANVTGKREAVSILLYSVRCMYSKCSAPCSSPVQRTSVLYSIQMMCVCTFNMPRRGPRHSAGFQFNSNNGGLDSLSLCATCNI